MLPVGDINSLLNNTDPRFLQIVTVNGQPTLQLVGATSLVPQSTGNYSSMSVNQKCVFVITVSESCQPEVCVCYNSQ